MNTTEYVLPLSCSCSNCDWNLCTMTTKISKGILICCCGEKPRSKQLVYTCTTGPNKEAAKSMKASKTCCQPKDVKKSGNGKDYKDGKSEPAKKNLKMSQKDKIDTKQEKKKLLKNERVDCICKGTKEKPSIFGIKSKTKAKKSDLYSKIEEIYKICCCELCNCPSPPMSQEKSSSDENERETQKVCLCFDNYKEVSERSNGEATCECPMKSETFKPCLCNAINKEPKSTTPIQLPPSSCEQDVHDKQPGMISPKPEKTGLNSPRNSKPGLSSPKPDIQSKDCKSMSPKPSCGQPPCHAKQEKEVKIILPSQQEKNRPELAKDQYHDDSKEVDTEVKNDDFPICDCATPVESLSLVCSCADSDISEDGYPTCACQPDDNQEEECPCDPGEMPATSSDEIAGTEEGMCQCTTCECIDCPNSRIKGETKDKTKGTRKTCKCTNCLMSTCRKNHNNCVCKRKRTDPNKQRKRAPQRNKYDIHRTLLCENLPFNKTASQNIFCNIDRLSAPCLFKDNRNGRLSDCYLYKNKFHEYENILGEVDHCKCSPCECQFCNKSDNTGLGKNKACRCTKCECIISCSNFCVNPVLNNRKQDTDSTNNKNLKYSRDIANSDCNDILYENLTLFKRGEILSNFKTDKEQLVKDQLRFGLNKDLSLPYVVIGEKIQVINTDKDLVSKNSVKKNSKEKIKANKNVTTRRGSNKNSKECINFLTPSNSSFIKRLTILEPERIESKITNKEETVRNVKIYVQLKNICDNVDEYIKHLQNLLEKSKEDNENFESIVEKIKTETVPRVLELIKKENLKNRRMQLQQ